MLIKQQALIYLCMGLASHVVYGCVSECVCGVACVSRACVCCVCVVWVGV